jgi:hypothetical protein
MKGFTNERICPNCGAAKMKNWHELSDEQKFLVERLPQNTNYTPPQRKDHRFCERCWFEEVSATEARA